MDPTAYRELHENAMKNNNGTSVAEVFINIVPSYFYTFLCVNLFTVAPVPLNIPGQFVWEFGLFIFTIILNLTILNDRIWEICSALLLLAATAAGRQLYKRTHLLPFVVCIPARRPEYLATVRATVNLLTAICILAVDFRIFPRKLAKTETFGFGLMDTGVGLYVFSNGVIDGVAAVKAHSAVAGITVARLRRLLGECSPLLLLGAVRFFVTSELDYQQHISEYGVHWNFFITLAITKLLGGMVLMSLADRQKCKFVAIFVVMCHQVALQLGMTRWVLSSAGRSDSWLLANREGVASVPGYVGLYLACVYIGTLLRAPTEEMAVGEVAGTEGEERRAISSNYITARQLLRKIKILGFHVMVLWKITYDCNSIFGVSRRLANMGYVLWILSIATTMTLLFMLLELFYYFLAFDRARPSGGDDDDDDGATEQTANGLTERWAYCPIIMAAINYNGLAFFLLANLLTGAVNLTFQTMLVSTAGCVFIVSVYMFVLCAIVTFLYVNQIKIKFW